MELDIRRLTRQYTGHSSLSVRRCLERARMALNELYTSQAEYALQRLQGRHYKQGEIAGRLLAAQLRQRTAALAILAIRAQTGAVLTHHQAIANKFASFYQHLYTPEAISSPAQIEAFLADLDLPSLSDDGRSLLDSSCIVEARNGPSFTKEN
ncbi:hypothetical protein NDU88_004615 [Pleurodeles waltl]|uniref:Uncharacterized protein n=1 Tax=Pleurodeles waltl TaxID=8319 RepID=A0AAV7WV75_PLEWA|nr:hypothetical protein NDU88_004615 [Pleurodeles waltl]